MLPGETELEMVRRHLREGLESLDRQRETIERLQIRGFPTAEARRFLATFEEIMAMHGEHLARLQAKPITAPKITTLGL